MEPIVLLNSEQIDLVITRLAYQLIEDYSDNNFSDFVIIGLQPRGIAFAKRVHQKVVEITKVTDIQIGSLDITFYRDDFRRRDYNIIPSVTDIDFVIENKNVVIIDDVFYTGRSVRSGLDAMLAFGRPTSVELMVLIDRRFHRNIPVNPTYIGKYIDTINEEKVEVQWEEANGLDQVLLYRQEEKDA